MDKTSNTKIKTTPKSLNTIPNMIFTPLIDKNAKINNEEIQKKYKVIDELYSKKFIENYINSI